MASPTDRHRIPQAQKEFNSYVKRVQDYLNKARPGELQIRGLMIGLSAQNISDLVTKWYAKWYSGNAAAPGFWEIHTNAYGPSKNSVNTKDVQQFIKKFNKFFLPLLNLMTYHPSVDSTDRTILNLSKRNEGRTFRHIPNDRGPHGSVKLVERGRHKLRIVDPANPDTKEQPAGVTATRIYRAVTEQRVKPQPEDYRLIGDTTTFEFLSDFDPSTVGMRAHYYPIWIDSKRNEGVKGNDFSETII